MMTAIFQKISQGLRAVARFFMQIVLILRIFWRIMRWSVRALFGSLSYQGPAWVGMGIRALRDGFRYIYERIRKLAAANPKRAKQIGAGLIAAAIAATGLYIWYESLPKPVEASFYVNNPQRTRIEDPKAKPDPLTVVFSRSVAPIDRIGKEIAAGVALSPELEGSWRWVDDQRLRFTPKYDWPIGVEYKVDFERSLIAEHIALDKYSASFGTAAFEVNVSEVQFYQDPVDPTAKKVVATVNFSHPVDTGDFEKRIKLRQEGKSSGFFGIGAEETKFRVSYDKLRLNAYIHSEPLPIPAKDLRLDLTVDSGSRAAQGGNPSRNTTSRVIAIPGLYSLKVQDLSLSQVENDQMEPDRVVVLNFSTDVPEKETREKLQAWLLPVYHPDTAEKDRKHPHYWDVQHIDAKILQLSEVLRLDAIASERDSTETHSFKFKADAGRQVYLKISKGVKSGGGYLLAKDVDRTIRVQPFPKQLRIMASGSLLAMSGEKKLPVLARDVAAMQIEIGRLLPQQLQHLVSMTEGSFSRPDFAYNFNESNLTERYTEVVEFPGGVEGRPQYSAVDFGRYLSAEGGRRGIFFLKIEPYDTKNKRVTGGADKRLVVVTDLGILVKKNLDGSQDVFVQSIHSGHPVANATVEVIGKNGLPVVSKVTDAAGRTLIPDLKGFEREREPVVYMVRQGGDTSFLPVSGRDRMLNFSRFDVGGVSNAADSGKLSAYLFSDRGIYRPGDEIRVGMIVKSADWGKHLAGIPLEVEVTDPRGLVVKKEKLKLSSAGFEELKFSTQDSSPTGDYNIQLYIVKDGLPSNQIGSVSVKVQEFLPDRMKITTRLSAEALEGWVSPQDLKARVTLQNLFGTPAENRRVRASMTLTPSFPVFGSHRGYQFYDPLRAKDEVNEPLAETTTNEKGEAEFDLNLTRFDRATYRVHVIAQGYEAEGGRSVSGEVSTLVSSMPYLVGWKADGDLSYVAREAERVVDLIAVDSKAQRIAVKDLTLVQIERKYVSVLTRQSNGTFRYESRPKEVQLSEKPFALVAKGNALALATDTPGSFAYQLRNKDGQVVTRIEYSVAGKGNLSRSLDRNAELQITLSKKDYKPGEDIELQIRAPYTGAGLITIERDRVYNHVWFKTSTTSSTQRIRLPQGLEGNGYVSVAFIRDPSSEEIYMSPLSYGVQPFSVNLDSRKNQISLRAPDLVKPGDSVKLGYKTERPSRIVVFAVDEGILQVARYKTADPLGYFFQKRVLDVRTQQILDLILPEYRQLMAGAAPGGDAEGALGKNLNPFKRKRDKPVAYWSGIIDSGPEMRELNWTVPDYFNGSLRLMAVAVSDDALGVFEKKLLVRGDIVLSPNAPTTVTPGDEFDVSVGVANNLIGSGANANVKISLKPSAHLEVIGASQAELKVGEMREGSVVFRVRAKDNLGSATLAFSASLNSASGRISTDLSVRPAMPLMTKLQLGMVSNGKEKVSVTRELYPHYRKLDASLSHLPLGLTHGLVAYLGGFNYSCTEQLVSQGIPALILGERPEFGYTKSTQGKTLADLVGILRSRQNAEGGFGLWAANHHVVEYVSVYAQHFILEGKERGHPIAPDMLQHGNAYLRLLAASEGNSLADERARAYAIYLLTRQGEVTANLVATLQKRVEERYAKEWEQDLTAAYLAASYQLMKQGGLAERMFGKVKVGTQKAYSPYYDSMSRDAQLVYLTAKHFPQRMKEVQADSLAALVKPMQKGMYNTFSSAYTILALDAVATLAEKQPGQTLALSEILRDNKSRPLVLPPGLLPKVAFSSEAAQLQFANSSNLAAYYVVNESGFDRKLPEKVIKSGLEILREFTDLAGKPVKAVKLGQELQVHLRFRAIDRQTIHDVALVDLFPGGFEVVLEPKAEATRPLYNDRSDMSDEYAEGEEEGDGDGEGEYMARGRADTVSDWSSPLGTSHSGWQPDYADVREDRVVIYGSVGSDAQEFVYRIRATNAGTFVVPPAFGESMYERDVQARSLSDKLTVEK
ncbi:MAG: hypothetical protein B7Y56_10285 [Gallionellales bacterium 35-53-114]|jgi:uncharacterized protein YfaS (alpha-2-macroglobulin family)|nr:MAG: hypothetical protein B7Y56_10285 [Gallionellales bacterium 35-53-114]OYZ62482.1 MAG: hypothetical protein B7Y04_14140 [Gallionellales bacterium 24-53-125]OZB08541.1 MAG: hypothetical protein B7X61_10350 [Gallionellales bacterium 39-52-133]HQS59511.1 alpha-2-macroglobulin [Gallionellaceae bacterium]HQS76424.1 alpha-2-macroglobulin [Gallionellaceae bacterium]